MLKFLERVSFTKWISKNVSVVIYCLKFDLNVLKRNYCLKSSIKELNMTYYTLSSETWLFLAIISSDSWRFYLWRFGWRTKILTQSRSIIELISPKQDPKFSKNPEAVCEIPFKLNYNQFKDYLRMTKFEFRGSFKEHKHDMKSVKLSAALL